jgi:hypothetical protein
MFSAMVPKTKRFLQHQTDVAVGHGKAPDVGAITGSAVGHVIKTAHRLTSVLLPGRWPTRPISPGRMQVEPPG